MEKLEPTVENREDLRQAPGSAREERDVIQDVRIGDYDYLANSAAGMDCTGLMNKTPMDEAEMASYQQVYQYLPTNVRMAPSKETAGSNKVSDI